MKKKFTLLILAILASLGAMASPPQQDEGKVAQIGETKYTTLKDAFAAAQNDETVTLLVDYDATGEPMYDGSRNLGIDKGITFNGDGHTLTVKNRGIAVGANASEMLDVTFQNITILNTSNAARCIDTRGNIKSLVLDNVTLNTQGASGTMQPLTIGGYQSEHAEITIKSSTIQTNDDATGYYAIITFNPVKMDIIGSSIKGWACIYAKGESSSAGSANSVITLDSSTLVSKNTHSGDTNSFAAIMIVDKNVRVNAENTTFNIINTGDQKQALVGYAPSVTSGYIYLDEGNKIAFDNHGSGSCEFVFNQPENSTYQISGGEFTDKPGESLLKSGLVVVDNDDPTYIYTVAPGPYVAQIGNKKYTSLQKAVDAAYTMTGDVTIELLEDITEFAVVRQKANLNLTIDGSDHKMVGQIIVDGDNRSTGTETLAIKNIKFEGNADDFLYGKSFVIVPNMKSLPEPYNRKINNYAHNVAISDCSFTSTSDELEIVGFTSSSGGGNCYNLVMSGVKGTNLHSMAQLTSSPNAKFDNCSVENSKSFIGANTASGTYVVNNCKFVSSQTDDGYAIRMKSNSSATLTLTNNDFTAFEAIRLGENNASSGNINIESGRYVGKVVNENTGTGKIVISGGHFSAPLGNSDYAKFIAEDKSGVNGIYLSVTPEAPNGVGEAVAELTIDNKTTNYASLEAAFGDATDGSTITLLKDCAGNGIKVPAGKFHNGLEVDFGGHTYTVDGTTVGSAGTETQAFQLLKNNSIFFTNGTIYSEKALFLVQNYSDLTLKDMTLTLNNESYASGYTLSNNNGTITIIGSTINANTGGGFAFDVCRYSSYPSVSVTVKGESQINGDVEVSASGNDAKDGFLLMLESGKINGDIVLDESAKAAMAAMAAKPGKAIIRERDSFGQPAPEGFKWQSEGNGNSILVPANYVAQVGDKKYETFLEAATAAAGTKVILLLQDISGLYTMSVGETLRVEKAGKAFDDPAAPDNNYTVNSMIEGPVTIYTLKAAENFASIVDGYYHIKNLGNEKYVNVKGRKTATVDATEADTRTAAGTVIKVKATNGQVEVLRSQAIDIPHYAERAMSYVPDVAKLLVEKLNATGSGEILGTTGFDAIIQKFNDSFDYHLYTEQAEGGVRIFGRTPSMKPVVEFYNEHKANVDAKLPQLESYINSAIAKVVDKVGKGGSLKESFKLHTIWERMDNSALTEPNDDASKLAFLQEVLGSETNVWNFAYETAMFYVEKVEGSSYFEKLPAEIRNYWNLAKQVRPDFKYYIVQKDGKMDFISEGNIDIKNNADRTIWALEPATEFDVEFNVTNKDGEGFATLYTDFGYQLPEGVTALKVTGIDADDIAQTEEIGNAVAAQTPVLLKAPTAGKQTLTIGNYGSAADGGELHGADFLIDQYEINEPELEGLFDLLATISESTAEKYDYLQRKNSGTVNNKYFFPMTDDEVASGETPIRTLTTDEEGTPVFAKTWTGVKANEAFMVSETIDPIYLDIPTTPDAPATIDEAYYRIKNLGNNQYVNVQGRKTATVDANEETAKTLPGTIIKVKSTVGVLDILRSQAVDVPRYAQRAMTYVPELAELIVEKLQATGSGEILGTTGFDAIMQKFNDSFDYHLHVVYADEEGDKYRIYGQIPTMKPVVEFYNEHKANVDYKLKDLETAVNGAIEKLVKKMGMGTSLINSFSLETIWQRMGSKLTKPADEATKLTFLQEVLSNETNVWDFAYQTVTFYMEKVENSQYFDKLPDNVKSYWNRAKNVHPGFKYYIVQKDNKMDIISQGNIDIQNDDLRTMWTLEPVETMTINVPEENSRIIGATFGDNGKRTGFETGYYTTLYTDFAYQLPEGVVALKVTDILDTYLGSKDEANKLTYEKDGITLGLGLLKTAEIGQEVPAQTPVLIMSKTSGDINITIGDDFGASADVSDNILHGADYLINEYEINTPALEGLFEFVEGKVSSELTDKYEHLIRKNSGTVNNKFFFSLNIDDELAKAYKKKSGNEMKTSPVLTLSKLSGKKLAFNESWDNLEPNAVFLFSEENKPALFTLTGDVTRDGIIDVSDVTGQTNIIQLRDKKEYNYDYEAADVIYVEGTDIDVSDVTGEVNIIQKRTKHPDLP